jgi:hypothetical protein
LLQRLDEIRNSAVQEWLSPVVKDNNTRDNLRRDKLVDDCRELLVRHN